MFAKAARGAQSVNAPDAPVPDRPNRVLAVICALTIPESETAGASSTGVPAFVQLAARHTIAGSSSADLATMFELLDSRAGGDYLALDVAARHSVLARLDANTFATDALVRDLRLESWKRLKNLILIGYYTSEAGASQELRFLPVPGRYQGDVPLREHPIAFASDWAGNAL